MRRTILYFAYVVIVLISYNCTKVTDYCWDCEYIESYNMGLCGTLLYVDSFQVCNKTDEEIQDFQDTYTRTICNYSSLLECKKAEDE